MQNAICSKRAKAELNSLMAKVVFRKLKEGEITEWLSIASFVVKLSGRMRLVTDVFKTVPGTPAYWKQFGNETFARMEQLGPFNFFFTLSCAEMKWSEVRK